MFVQKCFFIDALSICLSFSPGHIHITMEANEYLCNDYAPESKGKSIIKVKKMGLDALIIFGSFEGQRRPANILVEITVKTN